MKKTLAIILALTMILCVALTSCKIGDAPKEEEKEEKKEEVQENKDEASEDKAADDSDEIVAELNFDSLEKYNESLENVLAEIEPKAPLDEEVLGTVGVLPISATNVRYTYMVVDAPNEGKLTEEEIKDEIELFYKGNAALIEYAYKNNISLTKQDINSIKANITSMQFQLGDNYETAFAESPYTKFFYYFQTSVLQSLYSRLFEEMRLDHDSDMSKKVHEETLEYCNANDYVRAKHILIQFPAGEGENGELTDAQKQATLDKANEALEKVNAMGDISEFDALVKEYNEDPGMESYPGGYYFTKGEMVAAFEEAAYALEEGKTSGLVETPYGYHILLRLPLDDDAIYDSQIFFDNFGTALYNDITANLDSYEVVYTDNCDARIADFAVEYEELMAKTQSESTEETTAE
ncbi:MAG: peptidylprolyl isomerase [Clostridia bacterium]|nr:peptidylprolyl isomerase [Clostridia bacterium]